MLNLSIVMSYDLPKTISTASYIWNLDILVFEIYRKSFSD